MPSPNPGEGREDFLDRCMGDSEAVSDFPNSDQRFAFCNSQFESSNKADISDEDLDQGGRLNPSGRCPEGTIFDDEKGRCVPRRGRVNSARAHALIPINDHCCGVANRAHELQPLGNRATPEHEDPFLLDELRAARAMNERARKKANKVLAIYAAVLAADTFDQDAFEEATRQAEEEWQGTWNAALATAVGAAIASSLRRGEARISPGILQGVPSRQAVLDGMIQASKFHTNEFFNSQIIPALQRKVTEVLDGTATGAAPDLGAVRGVLDVRLKSVPYWRVVANSAASRSYHYGLLKAAQFQGLRGYEYVAVLDDRTSEICKDLNGRQWHLADAVNLVERAAASDDIDEVKRLTPWLPARDVIGKTNEELRDLGVIVPPVHGNCRSTIRAF